MARAPRPPNIRVTQQGAFEKLPGTSKRWRNIATGGTISDREMHKLSLARRGISLSREGYTKAVEAGTAAYASETVAIRQRHIAYDRQTKKAVPTMTPADRRFMIEARDAYLASRPLTPEQKDRWKSVFARYPTGELYALFGYSADASGAFPFEIAA
jgi:hypothetical protein